MLVKEKKAKELISFIQKRFQKISSSSYINLLRFSIDGPLFSVMDTWYQELAKEIGAEKILCGLTKAVLFFNEYPNLVIKIPFNGIAYCVNQTKEDLEEEEIFDDLSLIICDKQTHENWLAEYTTFFQNADNDNCLPTFDSSDYCASEAVVFQKAVAEGLEMFFAETDYLGEISLLTEQIPVYISERLDTRKENLPVCDDNDEFDIYTIASNEIINSANQCDLGLEHLNYFIEYCGESMIEVLLNFLQKWHINDLHLENLGINNKTKELKFIDYSGFYEKD